MQQWNKQGSDERVVDISRILGALLKKAWLILLVAVLCGLAAMIYSKTMLTPTYRSGFTAYVNNRVTTAESNNTSSGDLTASVGLTYVYKSIIEGRSVFYEAAALCDEEIYNYGSGCVSVYVSDTAPILTVYVETQSAELSKQMAEAIAQKAPEHVARVVDGSSMRIIDPPYLAGGSFSPNVSQNVTYGFFVGLVLCVMTLVVIDLIRDHVSSTEELEKRYEIPVIGQIPDICQAEKNNGAYGYGKAGAKRR